MPPPRDPVLILTGPPGAGKTTTARVLAGRWERAVHVESDRFFLFIRCGYVEPWKPESREQNEVVMETIAGAAASYASAGYFTIVDGIVLPRYFFEPLRDALREAGHPVAYAVLRAPLDVCLSRTAGRSSQPLADPPWSSTSGMASRIWVISSETPWTPAARAPRRRPNCSTGAYGTDPSALDSPLTGGSTVGTWKAKRAATASASWPA